MVRAILAGRKTQTRRVVRGVEAADYAGATWVADGDLHTPARDELCRGCLDAIGPAVRCPYGAPGDRLWVRETWQIKPLKDDPVGRILDDWRVGYAADGAPGPWRSPLFMPRWASRITLEVTAVRVERLQDITEEDARAEGVEASATTWVRHEPSGDWELSTEPFDGATPERATARDVYERLWHAINGKRAPWSSNPWVWVVSFRRVER